MLANWHQNLPLNWRDHLHNDEVLNVAVVFPEVHALQAQLLPAHADLILTQTMTKLEASQRYSLLTWMHLEVTHGLQWL